MSLKRVLFWLESGASMVVVLVATAILIWVVVTGLVSGDIGAWLRKITEIAAYFVDPAIEILLTEPLTVGVILFWAFVYVATTLYFAQTDSEKRLGKILIPLTLISLPVCAIAGFSMAIAQLASQGAGQ